jgi:hypothetical protein
MLPAAGVGGPLQRIPSNDGFAVEASNGSEAMVAALVRGHAPHLHPSPSLALAKSTSHLLHWAMEQICGAEDSVQAATVVLQALRQVRAGAQREQAMIQVLLLQQGQGGGGGSRWLLPVAAHVSFGTVPCRLQQDVGPCDVGPCQPPWQL